MPETVQTRISTGAIQMIIFGIDQSKRSTACVAMDEEGEMIDFVLITPGMHLDKEYLINYQWQKLKAFIESVEQDSASQELVFALEGAAFKACGASSDLLWGIQWYIRTRILVEFADAPVGILTPATWRSTLVPAKEQADFKARFGKIGLKHCVVGALPKEVHDWFLDHLEDNKKELNILKGNKTGTGGKYLESMFDLADAWGVAKHRVHLLTNKAKPKKAAPKKMSALKRRFPNAE
jgi:hypothetical protein